MRRPVASANTKAAWSLGNELQPDSSCGLWKYGTWKVIRGLSMGLALNGSVSARDLPMNTETNAASIVARTRSRVRSLSPLLLNQAHHSSVTSTPALIRVFEATYVTISSNVGDRRANRLKNVIMLKSNQFGIELDILNLKSAYSIIL